MKAILQEYGTLIFVVLTVGIVFFFIYNKLLPVISSIPLEEVSQTATSFEELQEISKNKKGSIVIDHFHGKLGEVVTARSLIKEIKDEKGVRVSTDFSYQETKDNTSIYVNKDMEFLRITSQGLRDGGLLDTTKEGMYQVNYELIFPSGTFVKQGIIVLITQV